jgi:hypothetical protein
MNKLYKRLDNYIKNELEDIAIRDSIDYNLLMNNYEYRKRNIEKCYGEEYKGRESRMLVKAYYGIKTYIRYLKNTDKEE